MLGKLLSRGKQSGAGGIEWRCNTRCGDQHPQTGLVSVTAENKQGAQSAIDRQISGSTCEIVWCDQPLYPDVDSLRAVDERGQEHLVLREERRRSLARLRARGY